jgi:nucleosome binding factor SPN SPT16 subunit
MKDFIETANITKTTSELNNLKISSEFTDWTFKKIIEEVESVFEYNKTVKHSHIQKKIEGCLEDETMMTSFLKNHPSIDSSFLEYPLPILIQSGSNFSLNKF